LAVTVLLLKADRDVLRERLDTGPWGTRSEVEYSRRCADELCPVAKRSRVMRSAMQPHGAT